jgi:signal transduction histidine kinase
VTSFFNIFFLDGKNRSAAYNTFVFFSVIFCVDLFYIIDQQFVWGQVNNRLVISTFFWHIFLLYVISAGSEIVQYLHKSKLQTASINQDLRDKKRILQEYNTRLRNDISKHLHGFLLTRVRTTATRLDSLAKEGNFEEYDQILRELLTEFSLEKIRERLNSDVIGSEFFVEFPKLWDGLVEVTFSGDLDFYTKFQPPQLVELAQVIEEIVANANRHGGADKVEISFETLPNGDLLITGRDNGRGVNVKFKEGLGSNLYTLASDHRWSIKNSRNMGAITQLAVTPYDKASVVSIH